MTSQNTIDKALAKTLEARSETLDAIAICPQDKCTFLKHYQGIVDLITEHGLRETFETKFQIPLDIEP